MKADNIYLKLIFSCTTLVYSRNKNKIGVHQTENISHCPSVVEKMTKFNYPIDLTVPRYDVFGIFI